jgi:2'-5' RNA ligase
LIKIEKKSRRFFIALPVDETAVTSLAGISGFLNKYRSSLKVVPADNYHLTLKFLGSLEPDIADSITGTFEFPYPLKRISYKIVGLGVFPSAGEPTVIWAGLNCDKEPLAEVIQSVENLASLYGFIPEKRGFVPHITLARVKKDRAVDSDIKQFLSDEKYTLFSSSVFKELVLFESVLKPEGAEYKKVKIIKLI